MKSLPSLEIDYITFSGMGEPTLASNLGEVIQAAKKKFGVPVVVLTNSSLLYQHDVRKELTFADVVAAKLDVPNQKLLELINRPRDIQFGQILDGIKKFRNEFTGKLALQIMFMNQNESWADHIARLAKEIAPHEVQVDTCLRPCPVEPLSQGNIQRIKDRFSGLNLICVYEAQTSQIEPLSQKATERRRPAARTQTKI